MEMKKIFDIGPVPVDMAIFFRNFVYEFEKTLFGGGSSPVLTFFEDGPREGYATTFKSVGDFYQTYLVRVYFQVEGQRISVLIGVEYQNTSFGGGFQKGLLKMMGKDFLEAGFAMYVEAATKKALRRTNEMTS
jgi:hypothetical protein